MAQVEVIHYGLGNITISNQCTLSHVTHVTHIKICGYSCEKTTPTRINIPLHVDLSLIQLYSGVDRSKFSIARQVSNPLLITS